MAWREDHIHVHIHNDDSEKIIKLLKEIKESLNDGSVKELESQMDSWLISLNQAFSKLGDVSDRVK